MGTQWALSEYILSVPERLDRGPMDPMSEKSVSAQILEMGLVVSSQWEAFGGGKFPISRGK